MTSSLPAPLLLLHQKPPSPPTHSANASPPPPSPFLLSIYADGITTSPLLCIAATTCSSSRPPFVYVHGASSSLASITELADDGPLAAHNCFATTHHNSMVGCVMNLGNLIRAQILTDFSVEIS